MYGTTVVPNAYPATNAPRAADDHMRLKERICALLDRARAVEAQIEGACTTVGVPTGAIEASGGPKPPTLDNSLALTDEAMEVLNRVSRKLDDLNKWL